MGSVGETDVTAKAAGVWSLSAGRLIITEPDGAATILVPTESVLLLAVDLPLRNAAKRRQALPFAVEDRIADPVDRVHLALGASVGPDRYLVGVVRHEVMAEWIALAEAEGLGTAALVPDALMLPQPEAGSWAVDLRGGRALVRSGDGAGFALPESMLRPAWDAAGRPPVHAYGDALPADMTLSSDPAGPGRLAAALAGLQLNLRQGDYAAHRAASNTLRRIGWIVALAAVAHTGIAVADTVMLRVIADRRAEDTRKLIETRAPGIPLTGDIASTAVALLPVGAAPAPQVFMPLFNRVSAALGTVGAITAQKIEFQGNTLTLDLDPQPGLAARVRQAMSDAKIRADVVESPTGIRIAASAQ
jgi:general secretion pathway protein L